MITFESFVPTPGVPLYQQILLYIKRGAVAGTFRNGDELPSRRVLSALLGANPNTVQKAYRQLEEEGLIVSHAGAKSFMSLTPDRVESLRSQLLEDEVRAAVKALRQMGLDREKALSLLAKYWD